MSTSAPEGGMIYEVNLDLDAAIADEYLAWLHAHVREILALPGFIGARLFQIEEPAPAPDRALWCVQYTLRDAAALEDYLRDHAPRLQAEGVARFGGRFVASRRAMQVRAEYGDDRT